VREGGAEIASTKAHRVLLSNEMHRVLEHPEMRHQLIPLSVEAYHTLGELGAVEEKSELIHGFIFAKISKSPRHCLICFRLYEALRAALRGTLIIRQEQPITCSDSEPEPDLAVVKGTHEDFARAHPSTAVLVVEIAISTLERDLKKMAIYAAAGVEEFWLIRPEENFTDVYTLPGPRGYASVRRVEKDGMLSPAALPDIKIRLEELLA
jgi:Uma2 family endonuclease